MICRHCEDTINETPIHMHPKCYHALVETIAEWEQKGETAHRLVKKMLHHIEQNADLLQKETQKA
jgi:hypothetical protein